MYVRSILSRICSFRSSFKASRRAFKLSVYRSACLNSHVIILKFMHSANSHISNGTHFTSKKIQING